MWLDTDQVGGISADCDSLPAKYSLVSTKSGAKLAEFAPKSPTLLGKGASWSDRVAVRFRSSNPGGFR